MTNTQFLILITVLVIIYWYWQQKQPTLKPADDEPRPKFSPEANEKPEVIWEPEPEIRCPGSSSLKIYQMNLEPAATPLSHKQKRQLKKQNQYD